MIPEEEPSESPITLLTLHVVVPAAIIAMVVSLLFYLVDVRSAFLGGGPGIKWVGFCFAVATVLIERYGRTSSDAENHGCFTGALAIATLMVLLVAPWGGTAGERAANLLIAAAIWYFATGVTRGMSSKADRPSSKEFLLGLDAVGAEEWYRERAKARAERAKKKKSEVLKNPAASVARLALLALLAFALGEPVLLQAEPQTGERALLSMIVFLFATGVVLSAGSTLDTLRRAERAGALQVSPGLVPGRLVLAGALLAAVLAAALAIPGIEYRGTGRLRPPSDPGEGIDKDRGYQEGEQLKGSPTGQQDPRGTGGDRSRNSNVPEGNPGVANPAAGALGLLAAAGKWLLYPLILVLALAGLWALFRLWPLLAGWRGRISDRLRDLLARLAGLFARRPKGRRKDWGADPLANLEDLAGLPPREAVLTGYLRFLALLDRLGHPRPEKATPYEVLHGLPPSLRNLEDPVRTLTDLYVQAAYAAEPVELGARESAILALKGIRGLMEKPAA